MAWSEAARRAAAVVRNMHKQVKVDAEREVGKFHSARSPEKFSKEHRTSLARNIRLLRKHGATGNNAYGVVLSARISTAARNMDRLGTRTNARIKAASQKVAMRSMAKSMDGMTLRIKRGGK